MADFKMGWDRLRKLLSYINITGGTIDNTPIGGTTPAAGNFTPLKAKGPAAITTFAGTASRSGTTLTFTSATDAVLAGYHATNPVLGTTVVLSSNTMVIISWSNSTTATVNISGTIAGATPTSVQAPISFEVDSTGALKQAVFANGASYFAGNVGIGMTNPTAPLHFGGQFGGNVILFDSPAAQLRWLGGSAFSNTGIYSGIVDQLYTTYDGFASQTRLTIKASNGNVSVGNVSITAGSGTGITVNSTGNVNKQVYQVTTTYAAYSDIDTKKGIVIATLPAKTKITGVYADTTVAYTGGAVTAATLVVGVTAEDGAEIIASHDVKTAAVVKGLADADMGSAMTRAAAIQGGYLPSWTGTTAVYATISTTGGNTNALTAGSTTFYIETERF